MPTWFDENVLRPEVAGLVGGVLGLFNTPGDSLREKAFNLGAGVSAAWFLAPALEDYLEVSTKNGQMAIAFVVGLIGMNLLAKAIAYARKTGLFDLLNFRDNIKPPGTTVKKPPKKETP
jgi:hypothetical protein